MPAPLTAPAHPYDPAALAALGPDRVATDTAHGPAVVSRAAVVVRFKSDAHGRNRWVATLKRSARERAARLAVPACEGPDAAAAALLAREGLPWQLLPAPGSLDGGDSYVYVAALTPGEGLALAHGDRAALALAACQELLAAVAGGADAAALALPVALARQATGAAPAAAQGVAQGDPAPELPPPTPWHSLTPGQASAAWDALLTRAVSRQQS